MADFEAPSFSLGLDFDIDSTSEPHSALNSTRLPQDPQSNTAFPVCEDDLGLEPELVVPDSDSDLDPDPIPNLKRLRRGIKPEFRSEQLWYNVDDEIEEFSSQEDRRTDEHLPTQNNTICSSSKFSLRGHGTLTAPPANQSKVQKRAECSSAPASMHQQTASNRSIFPELTISPLRRFRLIDSDSDSDDVTDLNIDTNKINPSSMEKQPNTGHKVKSTSVSSSRTEDLWKDFCVEKKFNVPTPALDEVCEEYFRSVKNSTVSQEPWSDVLLRNNTRFQKENTIPNVKSNLDGPPAHRYFFHNDPMIQRLVRSRLLNFFPLGIMNNREDQQPAVSSIDYMSQFGHGEGSQQKATGKTNVRKSSARGITNSRNSNVEDVASGSWVNPKSQASIPKNAGKRRVHADGQSTQPAGHWFTSPEGKKVYVTKNGQELTGRMAYRNYKKENGARFKKSKKKSFAKKKRKT